MIDTLGLKPLLLIKNQLLIAIQTQYKRPHSNLKQIGHVLLLELKPYKAYSASKHSQNNIYYTQQFNSYSHIQPNKII